MNTLPRDHHPEAPPLRRSGPDTAARAASDAELRRARWTYRGVLAGIAASALAILALALR